MAVIFLLQPPALTPRDQLPTLQLLYQHHSTDFRIDPSPFIDPKAVTKPQSKQNQKQETPLPVSPDPDLEMEVPKGDHP